MIDNFVDWWILTMLEALIWFVALFVKLVFNKYVLALFLSVLVVALPIVSIATVLGLIPDEDDTEQDG